MWPLFLALRYANVGRMPGIFHASHIGEESKLSFEDQQNLKCTDQGGHAVPSSGCAKLGWANSKTVPLLVSPWNVNIDGMPAILPCQFHDKKMTWLVKTKQISNWMMKVAMAFLLVVAVSLAELVLERRDHFFLPGNANIGGIPAIILSW